MRGSFFMAPDRTHMQRRRKMLLFMKVLFTQFIAEMGDKTQLMLVAMTSKFKLKDILLGTGEFSIRLHFSFFPFLEF